MKLLNVKSARSIWLFDLQDLNPKGKDFVGALADWVTAAYKFKVFPDVTAFLKARATSVGDSGPQALVFKFGHFEPTESTDVEGLQNVEINLEVYSDGLVAESFSSTRHTDAFLEHLLVSASKEFTLSYDASIIKEKLYVSEVHVKSDVTLEIINPRLQLFAKKLSELIPRRGPFQMAALGFWTDPGIPGGPLRFALERQAGKAFAQQRYFSTAPAQTDDHLSLLEELEQILLAA